MNTIPLDYFLRDEEAPPRHLRPFWDAYCVNGSNGSATPAKVAPPGLTIAGQTIQTLNGATSFRLFEPTEAFTKEMNMNSLFVPPLLILLGDEHFTREGQCAKCECGLGQECCYSTYDKPFLQLVDLLSTPKHPVQLYVEAFSRYIFTQHTEFVNEDGTLLTQKMTFTQRKFLLQMQRLNQQLPMLFANYFACYFRHAHPTARNRFCPTRRMQWHFSDPRINSHHDTQEGYTYDFEYKLTLATQALLKGVLSQLSIPPTKEQIDRLKRQMNLYLPQYNFLRYLADAINKRKNVTFENVATVWASLHQKSLLAKRLKKLGPAASVAFVSLFAKYLAYLCFSPMPRHASLPSLPNSVADLKFFQLLPAVLDAIYDNKWSVVASLCVQIQPAIEWDQGFYGMINVLSGMADFYAYLRCLISTSQGTWLGIMVFGENHCGHMHHFLTEISQHYRCVAHVQAPVVDATQPKVQCLSLSDIAVSLDYWAVAKGVWEEARQLSCSQPSAYTTYESNMETLDGLRYKTLGYDLWTSWLAALPIRDYELEKLLHYMSYTDSSTTRMTLGELKKLLQFDDHMLRVRVNQEILKDKSESQTQQVLSLLAQMQKTPTRSTRPGPQELYNAFKIENVTVMDELLNVYKVPILPMHIHQLIVSHDHSLLRKMLDQPGMNEQPTIMNQILKSIIIVRDENVNLLLRDLRPYFMSFRGSYDPEVYKQAYNGVVDFKNLVKEGAYRHVFEPL